VAAFMVFNTDMYDVEKY